MNSNYILPVSFAAAVHGALLFGFTKNPRPPVLEREPTRIIVCPLFPLPEDPEIVIAHPSDPSPKTKPDAPRPTNPETITLVIGSVTTMTLPPFERPALGDTKTIVPNTFGTPDGDGTDWRAKIASSLDLDNPPRPRFQASPHYPFEGKNSGLSGDVLVDFTVDESGRVVEPRVVKSSHRMFEEPTLRAVAKWQFEPGRREGRIVRFRMTVPVVFNLNE